MKSSSPPSSPGGNQLVRRVDVRPVHLPRLGQHHGHYHLHGVTNCGNGKVINCGIVKVTKCGIVKVINCELVKVTNLTRLNR